MAFSLNHHNANAMIGNKEMRDNYSSHVFSDCFRLQLESDEDTKQQRKLENCILKLTQINNFDSP